jgi:hypothetical protein
VPERAESGEEDAPVRGGVAVAVHTGESDSVDGAADRPADEHLGHSANGGAEASTDGEAGAVAVDGHLTDAAADDRAGGDWAWVEEWRESDESPAWGPGITLAVFAAFVVGSAVFVLSVGLADMPWLAVIANIVVAAGLAPALWLCRSLPVLRFIAGGAAAGVVLGWIAAFMH